MTDLQILADVALKVRLLDITGDGIEIPEKISPGQGEHSERDNADEQPRKALISGLHRIMKLLNCTYTSSCHVISCHVM